MPWVTIDNRSLVSDDERAQCRHNAASHPVTAAGASGACATERLAHVIDDAPVAPFCSGHWRELLLFDAFGELASDAATFARLAALVAALWPPFAPGGAHLAWRPPARIVDTLARVSVLARAVALRVHALDAYAAQLCRRQAGRASGASAPSSAAVATIVSVLDAHLLFVCDVEHAGATAVAAADDDARLYARLVALHHVPLQCGVSFCVDDLPHIVARLASSSSPDHGSWLDGGGAHKLDERTDAVAFLLCKSIPQCNKVRDLSHIMRRLIVASDAMLYFVESMLAASLLGIYRHTRRRPRVAERLSVYRCFFWHASRLHDDDQEAVAASSSSYEQLVRAADVADARARRSASGEAMVRVGRVQPARVPDVRRRDGERHAHVFAWLAAYTGARASAASHVHQRCVDNAVREFVCAMLDLAPMFAFELETRATGGRDAVAQWRVSVTRGADAFRASLRCCADDGDVPVLGGVASASTVEWPADDGAVARTALFATQWQSFEAAFVAQCTRALDTKGTGDWPCDAVFSEDLCELLRAVVALYPVLGGETTPTARNAAEWQLRPTHTLVDAQSPADVVRAMIAQRRVPLGMFHATSATVRNYVRARDLYARDASTAYVSVFVDHLADESVYQLQVMRAFAQTSLDRQRVHVDCLPLHMRRAQMHARRVQIASETLSDVLLARAFPIVDDARAGAGDARLPLVEFGRRVGAIVASSDAHACRLTTMVCMQCRTFHGKVVHTKVKRVAERLLATLAGRAPTAAVPAAVVARAAAAGAAADVHDALTSLRGMNLVSIGTDCARRALEQRARARLQLVPALADMQAAARHAAGRVPLSLCDYYRQRGIELFDNVTAQDRANVACGVWRAPPHQPDDASRTRRGRFALGADTDQSIGRRQLVWVCASKQTSIEDRKMRSAPDANARARDAITETDRATALRSASASRRKNARLFYEHALCRARETRTDNLLGRVLVLDAHRYVACCRCLEYVDLAAGNEALGVRSAHTLGEWLVCTPCARMLRRFLHGTCTRNALPVPDARELLARQLPARCFACRKAGTASVVSVLASDDERRLVHMGNNVYFRQWEAAAAAAAAGKTTRARDDNDAAAAAVLQQCTTFVDVSLCVSHAARVQATLVRASVFSTLVQLCRLVTTKHAAWPHAVTHLVHTAWTNQSAQRRGITAHSQRDDDDDDDDDADEDVVAHAVKYAARIAH